MTLIALWICFSGTAYSVPMYYNFTSYAYTGGDNNLDYQAYFIANQLGKLPDTLSFTFLVDTDDLGFSTYHNQTTYFPASFTDPNTGDHFDQYRSDLVDGSQYLLYDWEPLPDPRDGVIAGQWFGSYSYNNDLTWLNARYSSIDFGLIDLNLYFTGTINDIETGDLSSLRVDRTVTGAVDSSWLNVYLTLTSITPVPVPSAIWLSGSGLLGLIGAARRKKS